MMMFFENFFLNTNGFLHILSYTTARCGFALILSFLFVLILMPKYIKFSHNWQKTGQPIRNNYLPEHTIKQGTPTIGGLMIIISTLIFTCLFAKFTNGYILILLFSLIAFGIIGFVDDYNKVHKKDVGGIKAKSKFIFQILIASIVIVLLNKYVDSDFYSNVLTFPFFKNFILDLGIIYTFFRIFVIVGTSNAVNLTDGLDGLAIVPIIIVNAVFIVFAYIIGNAVYSKYLLFDYQNNVHEICIFLSSIIGSSLGFLWYNLKPAQIFMGDTGSLALGGVLGITATMLKCEFILAIAGGLFVIETMSVVMQVACFKITKGKKRLFKMSPIHHHFEKCGWSETQVVVRFWIISIMFALLALISLKVR